MNRPDLNRRLGIVLHDVSRLLKRRFDRRAVGLGLTRAQWSVIAHLYRQEGVNQATLADTLDVTQITLARTVDRLEAAGWVERRADPADRRAKLLYLTEKSHCGLEHMTTLADEVHQEALHGFAPEQHTLLVDLLLRVKGNLLAAQAAENGNGRAEAAAGK
jgi:MarR family transcriptional regulator, transcriptional regulator for hemolysin